jgi:CRP/FNR family transcriptional regulator, anaerobic regulatory protein
MLSLQRTSSIILKEGIAMTIYTETPVAHTDQPSNVVSTHSHRPERSALWSTLAQVCQLLQLDVKVQDATFDALFQHRALKPGQQAFTAGETFNALYVVNAGYLKTTLFDCEGSERVVNFPMKGDLLGADGICSDRHASDVMALSDCDLVVIPFKQLLTLGHACQELEHLIYRVVSRQIVQENINLATLGSLRSDARVACFLAIESDRHAALKFSAQSFRLRMTRREIGSYLGLTLETVSRSLSALDSAGLISVDQRDIKILQSDNLRTYRQKNMAHTKKLHGFKNLKMPHYSHKIFEINNSKIHVDELPLEAVVA